MKKLIKGFISVFNKLWVFALTKGVALNGTSLYLVRFVVGGNNTIKFSNDAIEYSEIHVSGNNNSLECASNVFMARAQIHITGDNNRLVIGKGVKLRQAVITLTGYNCDIFIGDGTTFGGVRMVNVGTRNAITIGEGCLFADGIEIWASDTHAIINEDGEFINPEKPVTIGNKVWVGSKVTILKGVTINDGAIIGMASVVTKDVPAGVVSVGYPNKTIKENVNWKLEYPFK